MNSDDSAKRLLPDGEAKRFLEEGSGDGLHERRAALWDAFERQFPEAGHDASQEVRRLVAGGLEEPVVLGPDRENFVWLCYRAAEYHSALVRLGKQGQAPADAALRWRHDRLLEPSSYAIPEFPPAQGDGS